MPEINKINCQAKIINSTKCSLTLSRILINGKWFPAMANVLLLEGEECIISFKISENEINQQIKEYANKDVCFIILEIKDIYENPYYYSLTYSKFENNDRVFYSLLEVSEFDKTKIGDFANE